MKNLLKALVICTLIFASVASAPASPVCQQEGEESWNSLQLYGFLVESNQPVKVGNKITYKFNLRNTGKEPVTIGFGGAYLKSSDGQIYRFHAKEVIEPSGALTVSSTFVAENTGQLSVSPGACISTSNGDICHDFSSCTFDVFFECPAGWSCMTAEEASGSYVRYSEEVCGYSVSGLAAMVKTPKYCFREIQSCPEGCECLTKSEAEKQKMDPCGKTFCGYENGQEKYCYRRGVPDFEVLSVEVERSEDCERLDYRESPVTFKVRNSGDGASPAAEGELYIDGTLLQTFSIPPLQPGEEEQFSFNFQVLCSREKDTIRVVADSQNTVFESAESNNVLEVELSCLPSSEGSDLTVVRIWNESYNNELRVYYEIKNTGYGYACSSQAGLFVDGELFAVDDVGPLAPKESREEAFYRRYSIESCTGNVFEVVADVDDSVLELDEGNNAFSVVWLCRDFVQQKPDLQVGAVWTEGTGNSDLTLHIPLQNFGKAESPQTEVVVYENGQQVATLQVSPISPGGIETYRLLHWSPQSSSTTITVCIDVQNDVDEEREDNNCASRILTFTSTCSDGVQNGDEEGIDCGGSCLPCNRCDMASLPSRFDWRDYVGLSAVRDQGSCGSCWAHSAVAALESALIVESGASSSIDLSEQHLLSCEQDCEVGIGDWCWASSGDCDGGWPHKALNFIINNGVPDESCFPYTATNGNCGSKCGDWEDRTEGAVYRGKVSSNVEALKRALICHGPLSVASENWEHALLLVGYDDLSTICTQKYGKSGCWILKNSWGVFSGFSHDVWHEYGYAYIPYSGFKYSDIKNGAYYVIPSDYTLHADFEMMDGLAAGDLDGDGMAEIVHADRGDLLQIFNIGGLQSSEQMDFEEGDRIATGDVDGDGSMDVIHADRGDEVSIHFQPPVGVVSSFYLDFEEGDDIAAGDVNGDGVDEIVHADRGDLIRVLGASGNQIASFQLNFEEGDRIAVGDVNGDGKDEIVHGDRGDWVRVYDMYGTKLSEFQLDFEQGDALQCGDLNGDGVDEIVHGDRDDWVRVYNMHGALLGEMRFNFEFGDGFAVADFNGDGKDDIIHGDRGDSFHVVKGERWFE